MEINPERVIDILLQDLAECKKENAILKTQIEYLIENNNKKELEKEDSEEKR